MLDRSLSPFIVLLLALTPLLLQVSFSTPPSVLPSNVPAPTLDLGKLPLSFIPNTGQLDAPVRFQVHSTNGTLAFKPDEVLLSLPGQPPAVERPLDDLPGHLQHEQTVATNRRTSSASLVRIRFNGANPSTSMTGTDPLPGMVNYFLGNEPAKWQTNVPTYGGIVYQQLYKGIDLHYDGRNAQLKGTYNVAPYADPSVIRWRYEGVGKISLDQATGDLHITTTNNSSTIVESAPVAWQEIDGQRAPVAVYYRIGTDNSIGFTLGTYDRTHPLTIDPILEYSTYLGGEHADSATSIAVDAAGNAYITGQTGSPNFPTSSALDSIGDGADAFVTKLSADGRSLIYSTYIGGRQLDASDAAYGIAVDAAGTAYVTGTTNSRDFPTVNAIQPTLNDDYSACDPQSPAYSRGCIEDGFVLKLSATGNQIIYSTYLGGTYTDQSMGIAVAQDGAVSIVGQTYSTDFPTHSALFDHRLSACLAPEISELCPDVFTAKLDSSGQNLVYSTYLGGTERDYGHGVAVDDSGNTYLTGFTNSSDFPIAHAVQPQHAGAEDIFVTKINASGTAILYSSYLGGLSSEGGLEIAVDGSHNAYITGWNHYGSFPLKNAFQSGDNYADAVVAKFDPDGNLSYSTYLGGPGQDSGSGIAVDSDGNAYITGTTESSSFPTANPIQTTINGRNDAFVTKLAPDGQKLLFSTYIGGVDMGGIYGAYNGGVAIAVDRRGSIFVAGQTYALDFPVKNAAQATHGGNLDTFVLKISDAGGGGQTDGGGGSQTTDVQVRDETNQPVPGAEVYRNGILVGSTSSTGTLSVAGLQATDTLVARKRVTEVSTAKESHNQSSNQNWAYRVYITSLDIPDNPDPKPPTVEELGQTPILTVKKSNTLIGFNIVTSMEWDADPADLIDLMLGFTKASSYLYDASDGQMLFERVTLYDNKQQWKNADYRFYADNTIQPHVGASSSPKAGQITLNNEHRAYFPRDMARRWSYAVDSSWLNPAAYPVLVHEFGHYGLDLADQYERLLWGKATCTKEKPHRETAASIMDTPFEATEFAMRGVNGLWDAECEKTRQWDERHLSDWEIITSRFKDSQSSTPRWSLQSPGKRGGVVPGPSNIPVHQWLPTSERVDEETGACHDYVVWFKDTKGDPLVNWQVVLNRKSGGPLRQGETGPGGLIEILGARNGDTITLRSSAWPFARVASTTVSCGTSNMVTTTANMPASIVINPEPVKASVRITPGTTVATITITSGTGNVRELAPHVEVTQTNSSPPVAVQLVYDNVKDVFTGWVDLDPALPQSGEIMLDAVDSQGHHQQVITPFSIFALSAGQEGEVISEDGRARLSLLPNTLSTNMSLTMAPAEMPGPVPNGWQLVGGSYEIGSETAATIGWLGLTLDVTNWSTNLLPDDTKIFSWSQALQQWMPLESTVLAEHNKVSASIPSVGTYAVFVPQRKVYIPVVVR